MATDTVQEGPEIMIATFSINSIPATVLFDSRASHTFISQAFVRVHSIPLVAMKTPMLVNSPGGTIPPFNMSFFKRGRFPCQSYGYENIRHRCDLGFGLDEEICYGN